MRTWHIWTEPSHTTKSLGRTQTTMAKEDTGYGVAEPAGPEQDTSSITGIAAEHEGTSDDRHDMQILGRKQVLRRQFNFSTMFGFASTVMVAWEFVLLTAPFGLVDGGTPSVFWGLILSPIVMLPVYASLAELASMSPTAAGMSKGLAVVVKAVANVNRTVPLGIRACSAEPAEGAKLYNRLADHARLAGLPLRRLVLCGAQPTPLSAHGTSPLTSPRVRSDTWTSDPGLSQLRNAALAPDRPDHRDRHNLCAFQYLPVKAFASNRRYCPRTSRGGSLRCGCTVMGDCEERERT